MIICRRLHWDKDRNHWSCQPGQRWANESESCPFNQNTRWHSVKPRIPADTVWSMSYETEWIVLEDWGQSTEAIWLLLFHENEMESPMERPWPLFVFLFQPFLVYGWTSAFLRPCDAIEEELRYWWWCEATLANLSGRLAESRYQGKTPTSNSWHTHNPRIVFQTRVYRLSYFGLQVWCTVRLTEWQQYQGHSMINWFQTLQMPLNWPDLHV